MASRYRPRINHRHSRDETFRSQHSQWSRGYDSYEPGRQSHDFRDRPRYQSLTPARDEHEAMPLTRNNGTAIEIGSSSNMPNNPLPLSSTPLCRREGDIKHLVELLCVRMYWYIQRDNQDKKLKRTRTELESCQPGYPETSPHSEVLKLQIDKWSKEEKKICERLGGTDGKLINYLNAFIDKEEEHLRSTLGNAVRGDDVDARLKALHDTLDEKFRIRINEESAQIININQAQLLKETEGLKIGLQQEREKNAKLQKRMKQMEERLDSLSKKQQEESPRCNNVRQHPDLESQLNTLSGKIDAMAQPAVTLTTLSKKLRRFDTIVSASEDAALAEDGDSQNNEPGRETRQCLQTIADELKSINLGLQCIVGPHEQAGSCADIVGVNSKEQISMAAEVNSIQASRSLTPLKQAKANDGEQCTSCYSSKQDKAQSEEMSDQKAQPLCASLKEALNDMMKEKLTGLASDLGAFIDKERVAREIAGNRADKALAAMSSLRQDVNMLKDEVTASMNKLDHKVDQQRKQVASCDDSLASLDSYLQRVSKEVKANAEKFELQLRVVNDWQASFTTKGLHEEFTRQITNNLPGSIWQKISTLTSRLETIEGRFPSIGDGTPWKRKKTH
ncbi:hypothetical protein NOR_04370 [Metarhizium rileyi]|uniref:Uncharacterized protein n=1 Tax=Metarhizium rileyi (strain RCEF 4871) TaxID=1649241 RepID=A0A162HV68_METRR|nr:hypothetical protein NOR_04370 [Metarhizium rileyi RCEF 4871]